MAVAAPPRVLISYSRDSAEHADNVLRLAEQLSADGVDCRLDQYLLNPSQGWPLWMEMEVEEAAFVLMIFTERYSRRSLEPRKSGARFESVLILNDMYDAGMINNKFIPVLFDSSDARHIHKWLRNYTYYAVDHEEGYEALRRRLLDDPAVVKPPIGLGVITGPTRPVGGSLSFARSSTANQHEARATESGTSSDLPSGLVNLSQPRTTALDKQINRVLDALECGDPIAAFDLAVRLHQEHPDHLGLKFHTVRALTSGRMTQKAIERFEEWKLAETSTTDIAGLAGTLAAYRSRLVATRDDVRWPMERAEPQFVQAFEDLLGLGARLLRELAWASRQNDERRNWAAQSAKAYARVHEQTRGFHPGFNAAAMYLLAGDSSMASAMAQRVITNMEKLFTGNSAKKLNVFERLRDHELPGDSEMRRRFKWKWRISKSEHHAFFWTLAQCYLIAGQDRSIDVYLIMKLANSQPANLLEASNVQRHLRHIVEESSQRAPESARAAQTLQCVRVHSAINYSGHMISAAGDTQGRFLASDEANVKKRIRKKLDELKVGMGVGSLACGADILFAEAILRRRAELHVVLPFDRSQFLETSVRRGGTHWVKRFDACLMQAASVTYATGEEYLEDAAVFDYASEVAAGLALLRARIYDLDVFKVVVWDGEGDVPGTTKSVASWARYHHRESIHIIQTKKSAPTPSVAISGNEKRREIRAVLFGDIKGFRKLPENRLRFFWDRVIKMFTNIIARYEKHGAIEFYSTWADGLFVVVRDVVSAATFLVELQESLKVKQAEFTEAGFPRNMALRLIGQLGPVFTGPGEELKKHNWFGSATAHAAQMEPVTPPGETYVTEPFAAILALYGGLSELHCEYDGEVPSAKDYGDFRMYRLRRATETVSLTVSVRFPPFSDSLALWGEVLELIRAQLGIVLACRSSFNEEELSKRLSSGEDRNRFQLRPGEASPLSSAFAGSSYVLQHVGAVLRLVSEVTSQRDLQRKAEAPAEREEAEARGNLARNRLEEVKSCSREILLSRYQKTSLGKELFSPVGELLELAEANQGVFEIAVAYD